jgi:hypothetical protein
LQVIVEELYGIFRPAAFSHYFGRRADGEAARDPRHFHGGRLGNDAYLCAGGKTAKQQAEKKKFHGNWLMLQTYSFPLLLT